MEESLLSEIFEYTVILALVVCCILMTYSALWYMGLFDKAPLSYKCLSDDISVNYYTESENDLQLMVDVSSIR